MGDHARRQADDVRARTLSVGQQFSRRDLFGIVLATAGLAACGVTENGGDIEPSGTAADRSDTAFEAYIFGYPLMLIGTARAAVLRATPSNLLLHETALPAPPERNVVRVDVDALFSSAWLDLRAEPVLFEVPRMPDRRYWLMQLVDAWSNTGHCPTEIDPLVDRDRPRYTYAAVGPQWSGRLPDGVTALPMSTADVWFVGRIEVRGSDDMPAARAMQNELKLAPLSAWDGRPTRSGLVPPAGRDPAPVEKVEAMVGRHYFERMCSLLESNPPVPPDEIIMRRLATIGIEPGGRPRGTSDAEMAAGINQAKRQIAAYLAPGVQMRNGWVFDTRTGDYGADYLLRAAVASQGLGANLAEVVMYAAFYATADQKGTPTRFRLRFPSGQTPPVDAFWSLTAYNGEGWLVPNSAQIYAVGHSVPPVPSSDGSIEFAVQHADPGPGVPAGNWLPIPERGQFSLVLRMYAPQQIALDGDWAPPPLDPLE